MKNVVVLSGGTDGTDGPTDAAGGIVDGGTVERARRAGASPRESLDRNDSYALLEKTGDLLVHRSHAHQRDGYPAGAGRQELSASRLRLPRANGIALRIMARAESLPVIVSFTRIPSHRLFRANAQVRELAHHVRAESALDVIHRGGAGADRSDPSLVMPRREVLLKALRQALGNRIEDAVGDLLFVWGPSVDVISDAGSVTTLP